MKKTTLLIGILSLASGMLLTPNAWAANNMNGQKFEQLWEAVTGLQADLAASVSALQAEIAAGDSALQAQLDALAARVGALESENATQQLQIDANSDGIHALWGAVDDLGDADEALQAQIDANADGIQALWSYLAGIRAWEAETSSVLDNFASTSYTTILSDSVDVPADGTLLVWANVNAEFDIDSPATTYRDLEAYIAFNGSKASILQDVEHVDVSPAGLNDGESMTIIGMVPVGAGTHSLEIKAKAGNGTGMIYIKDRSLHSLFLPSVGASATASGMQPLSVPVEPAVEGND